MKKTCQFPILMAFALLLLTMNTYAHTQNHTSYPSNPSKSGYVAGRESQLFYQRFGSGAPIIVVHGGPGLDQGYLMPQMLELAKEHELIFYDQRGSGRSLESNIDPKYVSAQQFAEDLEMLRSELGLKKVTILGHSWGGFVAMNYAIQYPQNISSLILVNSVPADFKGQKAFTEAFSKRTQPIMGKIAPLFNYEALNSISKQQINQLYRDLFSVYFKDPSQVEKLTLDMDKNSALGGFKVMSLILNTEYFKPECNLIPALHKLNMPTLIVHGNQDILPIDASKNLENAIPNTKAVYLNDCGHFPYIEKPDAFFSALRSFLSTVKNQQQ